MYRLLKSFLIVAGFVLVPALAFAAMNVAFGQYPLPSSVVA